MYNRKTNFLAQLKCSDNVLIGLFSDIISKELSGLQLNYACHEMWVRGHSRSLKLVPFERLGAVSYSPSTITMAVSVAVCEILNVKNV